MIGFLVLAAASAAFGFLVGRWIAVGAAVGAWIVFFGGLAAGWWGDGLGDAWQISFAVGSVTAGAGAAAGVAIGRAARSRGSAA